MAFVLSEFHVDFVRIIFKQIFTIFKYSKLKLTCESYFEKFKLEIISSTSWKPVSVLQCLVIYCVHVCA